MARRTTATIALLWLVVAAACGDRSPTSPSPSSASGTLRGIVADEAGARLAALVSIRDAAGRGRLTESDGNGEYRFGDVASGDASVRVWKKGYQDVERSVSITGTVTLNVTLLLLPKGVLSGVVTDIEGGAPIAGATVVILDDRTTEVIEDWGRMTTTDGAGRYAFENVTLGNVNVSATAPGYHERRAGQHLGVRSTLDFALRRTSMPEIFTGQVGWTDPPGCVLEMPGTGSFACVSYPLIMRRSGSIDGVVTWHGGTGNTISVHLLEPTGFVARVLPVVRSSDGTTHRLSFSQATFTAGTHWLRVFDSRLPRQPGFIPFTLAVTRSE